MTFKNNKKIGIYGTGLAAKMVFDALKKMGMQVSFFLDCDKERIGKIFCDREILDISRLSKETFVLIAANPSYRIHERLQKCGLQQWRYVDPEFLHLLSEGYDRDKIKQILKKNEDKILQVYNLLEDEKSKQVLHIVLKHRLDHELEMINEIYDENQYFGNDLIGKVNGSFVDCGAFDGDTMRRFMKQVNGKYHYYAFEAEKENYDKLEAYCNKNGIEDINLYNIAVYDKKTQLVFLRDEGEEKVSGRTLEIEGKNDYYVKADSIDNVIGDKKVDMITMDIEGAEIYALYGAQKCINNWQPRLAVSAYHAIDHLWEVPLLIKNINPDYRIFYRHHRWNMHDTVCYAISPECMIK